MDDSRAVIYWDASAVLSAVFQDSHSKVAQEWMREKDVHLISSLSHAETCAVIARMQRESVLTEALARKAFAMLEESIWRRLNVRPRWDLVASLSMKWPLRGTDLWHLATAKTLKAELSELVLLTFDTRLHNAARGEGL